jgi:hypothetical protein
MTWTMVSKPQRMSPSRIVERGSGPTNRAASLTTERPVSTSQIPGAIRILLVDDHPVVRAGLTSMLSTIPRLAVCGAASSGEEALQMANCRGRDDHR